MLRFMRLSCVSKNNQKRPPQKIKKGDVILTDLRETSFNVDLIEIDLFTKNPCLLVTTSPGCPAGWVFPIDRRPKSIIRIPAIRRNVLKLIFFDQRFQSNLVEVDLFFWHLIVWLMHPSVKRDSVSRRFRLRNCYFHAASLTRPGMQVKSNVQICDGIRSESLLGWHKGKLQAQVLECWTHMLTRKPVTLSL